MNSYKLLIHVVLFYLQSTNTKANNWTVAQWEGNIDAREIIVDGKITTVKGAFDQSISKDEVEDMDSFVKKYPHLIYTAIKCKYSDAVIDILQTLYEYLEIADNKYNVSNLENYDFEKNEIELLKPIISVLNTIKPKVVKIIYNLFFYWEKYPELRTTDQNLLKSMLSINLFLYYNHKQPYSQKINNVNILLTVVLRMINLLESFRLKNCHVEDPYQNYTIISNQIINVTLEQEDNIISIILEPKIKDLEILIINGPFTYDGYNEDMYNPEYLLFEEALKLNNLALAKIVTSFKGKSKFLDAHCTNVITKLAYDIKEIFDFQYLLIKTIIGIFFKQLFYFLTNTNEKNSIDDMQILLTKFIEFSKKIMPSNCLTSACQAAKNFVNLRIYKEGKILFIEDNVQMIKTQVKTSLDIFSDSIRKTDAFDPNNFSLEKVIDDMLKNKQYKTFNQTIKLFTYESNTNSSYYILKFIHFYHEPDKKEEDEEAIQYIDNLRITLLSFRKKLNSVFLPTKYRKSKTRSLYSNVIDSPYEHTFNNLQLLFNYFQKFSKIQDALLPLLVYLHYESRTNNYDIQLGRILYLTINNIENSFYCLFNLPPSNLLLHLETKIVPRYTSALDLEISQKLINDDLEGTISIQKFNERYNNVFSVYDNNWLWPDINEDIKLQFYSGGKKMFASDVFKNYIWKITVIDHQDLVKIQWLTIKWFLAKILLKVKYVLTLHENLKNSSDSTTMISNHLTKNLNDLINLRMPVSLKNSIDVMVKVFKDILTYSRNTHIEVAKRAIDEYLSILGSTSTDIDYGSPEDASKGLEADIKNFTIYLNEKKNKSILLSKNTCFSTILFPV